MTPAPPPAAEWAKRFDCSSPFPPTLLLEGQEEDQGDPSGRQREMHSLPPPHFVDYALANTFVNLPRLRCFQGHVQDRLPKSCWETLSKNSAIAKRWRSSRLPSAFVAISVHVLEVWLNSAALRDGS